jgi:hypothetical protein
VERRLCPEAAWAAWVVWTISPPSTEKTKARDFFRAFFLLSQYARRRRIWVIVFFGFVSLLGQQSGFCQTISNPLDVLFPLERLPAEMFVEGVFWVDLLQFLPDAAGLVDLTEMTKR